MDALEESRAERVAEPASVEALLQRLESAAWQESPAVGEGQEYRADPAVETHASALLFSSSLLHGSAVVGAAN
jgi:hypothetical protein